MPIPKMCDMPPSKYNTPLHKLSHKNNLPHQTYFLLQFKKCDLPHYMYKMQKTICEITY